MKIFGYNPHKTLMRLVVLNIVFDVIAVAMWVGFPEVGGNLHYVGTLAASVEAAIAAGLFAVALLGLARKQLWGLGLAIAVTMAQRIFAAFVFFPSLGIIITLIWSSLIVYFGYRTLEANSRRFS
jgi:hypothetical protein